MEMHYMINYQMACQLTSRLLPLSYQIDIEIGNVLKDIRYNCKVVWDNVSNVYFYNYARRFDESVDLYQLGPYYKNWILDLASKLQGSIKVNMSVEVEFDQDLINLNNNNA